MMNIDIGICAYNEEANIGFLLKNLSSQPFDEDFHLNKIIVVASGCTDKTEAIVREYGLSHANIELIIEETRRGKVSAVNLILNKTRADVLIFVDADIQPAHGSLNKLLRRFQDKSVGAVAGRPVPVNDRKKFWGFISHLAWNLHHEVSINSLVKLPGELYAIRPGLVKKIPRDVPWDESFFEALIRKKRFKIVYAGEAIVHVKGPEGLLDTLKHRRKLLTGFLQFKKTVNYTPPTMSSLKIASVITRIVNFTNLRELAWFILAVFLEIFARLLSLYDFQRIKIPYRLERIASTKNLKLYHA